MCSLFTVKQILRGVAQPAMLAAGRRAERISPHSEKPASSVRSKSPKACHPENLISLNKHQLRENYLDIV
jgi:hypothetical protein